MALLSKHKEVESELAAARERLQQQASDLVLKASMSGSSSGCIPQLTPTLNVNSKQNFSFRLML